VPRLFRAAGLASLAVLLITVVLTTMCHGQPASEIAGLRQAFAHPPDNTRIMMRWWWFGPAVAKPELRRELEQMKAAGIGGVEIATLYPLALDDPSTGFHNQSYLSDEYIEALRFAASEARRLGLRVDVTLCSGWPFGGPHIPVTEAAGELRVDTVAVTRGAASVPVPSMSSGESLIAAFWYSSYQGAESSSGATRLSSVENGRLQLPTESEGEHEVIFFFASRTGMMVKRPAVGAEGFVLDHYDQRAIETHLHAVGDRLMSAFIEQPPYAVFSDSLEDYGSNWTADLLVEFQHRRGYDLTPYLPALVGDAGPETAAVRHDWGRTLTELANERFMEPTHAWAQKNHTLLRSQTYGFPPVTLSSNEYEDLPEGEGKATLQMWRQFSDTRWAASAGHLFGHPVISSEAWTWLHSPAFRATPLDMKAEADLHFLQGINQLIGHGWPYSPDSAGEPGWRMYAAGAFNSHNPWAFVMPDLASYLQRVSFVLRQGEPANDVALLLPNDDAWSSFKANRRQFHSATSAAGFDESGVNVSIDESMGALLGSSVISSVLDAGFNLDFIDGDFIDKAGINYKVLILPGIDRLPLTTYKKIEEYARRGGIVIATRRLPATAPGFLNAASESAEIQQLSQQLFQSADPMAHFTLIENSVGHDITNYLKPDVVLSANQSEIGFIHRKLPDGDLYFIANTSNRSHHVTASFRSVAKNAEWWDAYTGEIASIANPDLVDMDLQPYESRLIVFSDHPGERRPGHKPMVATRSIDISTDWEVVFEGMPHSTHLSNLGSWSDEGSRKYYSGVATYDKKITLSPEDLRPGAQIQIDFGNGVEVPVPAPLPPQNMRAYLESPVREAAEVYVNGVRAGVVWHPPYRLAITPLLKSGENDLRILVGNTAINELSGRSLPDYRLLNARYGVRFIPQGMENLQPLPSGMLGPVRILVGRQ